MSDVNFLGEDLGDAVDSASSAGLSLLPASGALFTIPDFSGVNLGATGINLGAVTPAQTGGGGSIFTDLTNLLGVAGQLQQQGQAIKSANALAAAKQANALQTVQTTPNVWMVLGIGALAVFTLEILKKPAVVQAASRK